MISKREELLEQIDNTLKQQQMIADKQESLKRLMKNKDFQQIVLNGYLRDEAVRAVEQRAEPAMQEHLAAVDNVIVGIGQFHQYLKTINRFGDLAHKNLEDLKQSRIEILDAPEEEFEE